MNYDSIIPKWFVPSNKCAQQLSCKSVELAEQSLKAAKRFDFKLAGTLFDLSIIYSDASNEAYKATSAASKQWRTLADKKEGGEN